MNTHQPFQNCIEAWLRCAAECQECASFCLREEENPILARCIQLNTECAAICYAAAQLMAMGSKYAHEICRICADICEACAKECEMHEVDHCERCAIECRACAEECRKMEFAAHDAWEWRTISMDLIFIESTHIVNMRRSYAYGVHRLFWIKSML